MIHHHVDNGEVIECVSPHITDRDVILTEEDWFASEELLLEALPMGLEDEVESA